MDRLLHIHGALYSTATPPLRGDLPDGSKDFYGKLFGWGMQDMPMGDETCTMFKTTDSDDDVHGGITQSQSPDGTSSCSLMFWSRTSTRL